MSTTPFSAIHNLYDEGFFKKGRKPLDGLTDDEFMDLIRLEKHWQATQAPKLMEDFLPEAKHAALRATRARIKETKKRMTGLNNVRSAWDEAINAMHFKKQPEFRRWLDEHIERLRAEHDRDLKKYHYELSYLSYLGREEEREEDARTTGGVTDEQVARAKEVAVKDILGTTKKIVVCLWHEDRNPSLHLYEKRVHCYACDTHEDSIGLYMKLNGCDFITAVKALAP